jgi:tetratricopeptide (TPR) repeat protein
MNAYHQQLAPRNRPTGLAHLPRRASGIALAALFTLAAGCDRSAPPARLSSDGAAAASGKPSAESGFADPCQVALAPQAGDTRLDADIRRAQEEVRQGIAPERALERLGWLFVSKARATFDDGFYTLAEQCARCLDARQPGSEEAMLLRGHALHNLHRFKEAELLASQLVSRRGAPFDFGLLADALMEQGRLDEAVVACQKMLDLKPDLHAYARAAHLRWLKGDLDGASEAMDVAARAASPRDPATAAWLHTRLGLYDFQAGRREAARRNLETALALQKDYPPALLVLGRVALAEENTAGALAHMTRASRLNPLPEYQWALADTLRLAGRTNEAAAVEDQLASAGAAADPRTCALFLATRRRQADTALRLASRELEERADIFTQDTMAWALAAARRWSEARGHMRRALAEGTQDARLFLHAGVIAAADGDTIEARSHFAKARALQHLLLPGERAFLPAAGDAPETTGAGRPEAPSPLAARAAP